MNFGIFKQVRILFSQTFFIEMTFYLILLEIEMAFFLKSSEKTWLYRLKNVLKLYLKQLLSKQLSGQLGGGVKGSSGVVATLKGL